MFTLEVIVPKQHVPEKFDKYISSSRIKVKETGELVKLTKSSIPKIIGLKLVTVNNVQLKDKSTKVKPNDHIIIKLTNIDQYKVESKGNQEQKESNNISKQTAWWDKNAEQQGKPQTNKKPAPAQAKPISTGSKGAQLASTDIKLEVLYEDDNLAVINKPAGMLVHPSNTTHTVVLNKEDQTHTLVNALIHRYGGISKLSNLGGNERPGIVHRLDKDTAGIIIIARNNNTHKQLQALFEEHTSTMIKNTTEEDQEPENMDEDDISGDDSGDYYDDDDNNHYGDDSDDDDNFSKPKSSGQVPSRPATITANHLSKLMEGKTIPLTIQKKYHCIVLGKPKETHGFINKKIARHPGDKNKMVIDERVGKEALTEYKILKVWDNVDVQVYDEKKNKLISKPSSAENTNSTLSEYDNVSSQLNKNKKKNKKSVSNKPTPKLNSRMSLLSVDDDEDDENDEKAALSDSEDDSEDAVYLDSDDDSENAVYLDGEDDSEEDDDEEDEEDDDDDEEDSDSEVSTKKENYDEIIKRLQRTKSIGSNTFSLLEITLHTGRSHQIRVHMASENLPIVGDPIYSSKSKQFLVSHLLLASVSLKFVHPILNQVKEFTIEHPSHFKQFIDSIENNTEADNNNQKPSSSSSKTSSKKINNDFDEDKISKKSIKNISNKTTPQSQKVPTITTTTTKDFTATKNNVNNNNNNSNNNSNNNKNKKKNNNFIKNINSLDEKLEKDLLSSFIN
ncbi:hypothetical protein DICPUDRAFT_81402 [Dictyostelium purpureum]|uniref:Pseudouridine synthase RsuA/RluA-like domain-containing protein n=1 Tax=Dictyostelium purpureum TaxID=5786 RepID=F0ZTD4_DICPU|nr:uncharacterized protein DICPUDRAFT_81402 [Dictyostelium purpureum]EGC32788.1 hypothetical protein DICPUDRAFT_81402 [Dictyostelium purpureum]|eukprot:XP_003290676.1 hypothetical protein DICPUDRAFT_81402 [Dictyostelium purpureum]